ncbi:carbohydrate kinase [Jiangella sp. DSM 45060]|uniref:carbohydrate kinase family protein n=1 Tax=Jiangella sp. DSM 45060 TaxID=1798224 RepID=UPI0008793B4C|nr:carbohydrate kinase [Jiangella sp. DSM 45060]SDS61682.1 fructokinase [Jiangella sp. DSM 45060]
MTAGDGAGLALVVGEALTDVIVERDGAEARHPGGSPANVAYGLGRLGRRTALVTELGDDAGGAAIRAHLASAGVEVRIQGAAARTSSAIARLGADGSAEYRFELTWELRPVTVAEPPLVLHTGSLAASVEPGAAAVERLARDVRADSTVSYDPNIRPDLMGGADDLRDRVERLVAGSDVVKASDQDTAFLAPGRAAVDVARDWLRLGPALVVVTLGGEGAVAVTAGGEVHVPAAPVTVADTVGAGDSFTAGLLDGLWDEGLLGGPARPLLRAVPAAVVERVVRRATLAAAVTVSRAGANPPTRAELDAVGRA